MPRYMIESPHTGPECLMALENFLAIGYLTHFEWGCESGYHCGWAVLEAATEEEALLAVPSVMRSRARAVPLTRYTPEDIAAERVSHRRK